MWWEGVHNIYSKEFPMLYLNEINKYGYKSLTLVSLDKSIHVCLQAMFGYRLCLETLNIPSKA